MFKGFVARGSLGKDMYGPFHIPISFVLLDSEACCINKLLMFLIIFNLQAVEVNAKAKARNGSRYLNSHIYQSVYISKAQYVSIYSVVYYYKDEITHIGFIIIHWHQTYIYIWKNVDCCFQMYVSFKKMAFLKCSSKDAIWKILSKIVFNSYWHCKECLSMDTCVVNGPNWQSLEELHVHE